MIDRPLLTMTLIAKDEADNIQRCFDSWWDDVDEVVLLDTGSSDDTIKRAQQYAWSKKQPDKLIVSTYNWRDDFAAARNAADELASGRWFVWCDLDDEIRGLDQLRKMAEAAPDDVVGFFLHYDYAQDPDGNSISELWRERVVRNNGTQWTGRLHEHKLFTGGTIVKVDPAQADWIHRRDHSQRTGERNLRILEAWDRDDPDDARIVQAIAMELMGMERYEDAANAFSRYLALPGEPPDRRAQASRHLSVMLLLQGNAEQARQAAFQSLSEHWLWADTHLSLAEIEQTLGRPDVAFAHAQTALQIGKPDTLLIVNPLMYTAQPRALMAVCLAQMGRFEEAIRAAEEAVGIAPSQGLIKELSEQHMPVWRGQLKKQHTLAAFMACADVLVEVGELVKAQDLLATAPYFIDREGVLIQRRGQLARAIAERMATGALVEDKAADQFIKRHQEAS